METLQWLKTLDEYGTKQYKCTYHRNAGHVSMLRVWLFWNAIEGGHMETVRWLKSEGCPWNVWACITAAEGGHLEILKWLRREGCLGMRKYSLL